MVTIESSSPPIAMPKTISLPSTLPDIVVSWLYENVVLVKVISPTSELPLWVKVDDRVPSSPPSLLCQSPLHSPVTSVASWPVEVEVSVVVVACVLHAAKRSRTVIAKKAIKNLFT
jgi:hypothetical protein